jgi:putative transposase
MRFVFIAAEKANFRVVTMCRVLRVARSGFYAWCKRGESTRARSAKTALVHIRATYRHHKARYGSPRVHRELCDQGLSIGRHRVARLMKSEGLYARQKRRFRKTTNSNHGFRLANNLVARHFEATAPNRIWLSDITYVYTREGWLYLVCFLDVHSRRIVGWDIDDTLDASSTCRALCRALAERRPSRNLVIHSDRGIPVRFRRVSTRLACARHHTKHEPQR